MVILSIILSIFILCLGLIALFFGFLSHKKQYNEQLLAKLHQLENTLLKEWHQASVKNVESIQHHIHQQMTDIRAQLEHSFKYHTDSLSNHVKNLNQEVKENLFQISQQVHQQLHTGFEKSAVTFSDVLKRLVIIDEAQKKITELSSSVVDLQEVLSDRKSRGAFGEVQLSALIHNMIPAQHFAMQHTLSNQKRADCILFLPQPSGNVVIDAKFPLESYRSMMEHLTDKTKFKQQFRIDIKKHIQDIASKYIIPDETADGAIMFIPAEAIFAEIHSNYPDLVALSHAAKVWMVSPTTLMAVLTTARAVLKDEATRKQIHIIQQHLHTLAQDFKRFDKRIVNLSRHIALAHQDVEEVTTSAKKISQRFEKIEHLDLAQEHLDTTLNSEIPEVSSEESS